MSRLILHPPAKLNLYLRLMGKRTDGYNNLCTVFQKISLTDTLTIEKAQRFHLIVAGNAQCVPRENLVYRAYQLFRARTNVRGGARFHLEKNIPVGAGLGGASSDAASTLLGLNRLFKTRISRAMLMEWGGEIGADIPFFISSYPTALGIERGDMLINLRAQSRLWVLLIAFDQPLSTARVYRSYKYYKHFRINLTKVYRDVIMLIQFLSKGDISLLGKVLENDLMKTAERLHKPLSAIMRNIKQYGFKAWGMSGSGPTLFVLFRSKNEAEKAERMVLSYSGIRTVVARTAQ